MAKHQELDAEAKKKPGKREGPARSVGAPKRVGLAPEYSRDTSHLSPPPGDLVRWALHSHREVYTYVRYIRLVVNTVLFRLYLREVEGSPIGSL